MTATFFSGAGLSAESGVAAFRGADGLYDGRNAEDVLSAGNYRQRPEDVEAIIDALRAQIARATPNVAHLGIAAWCAAHPGSQVITQNVDDLLERAGVPQVIHLHGEIGWLRCLNNRRHRVAAGVMRDPELRCKVCRSRLRSDVVLFDEPAPRYADLYRAIDALRPNDVVVVIGTQGNVVRISDLLRGKPGYKILNNLEPSPDLDRDVFDELFEMPATRAWADLERRLARLHQAS